MGVDCGGALCRRHVALDLYIAAGAAEPGLSLRGAGLCAGSVYLALPVWREHFIALPSRHFADLGWYLPRRSRPDMRRRGGQAQGLPRWTMRTRLLVHPKSRGDANR